MPGIFRSVCAVAIVVFAAVSAFANSAVSFNFSGLIPGEQPLGYYAGGTGSLGSGPGPKYGIAFSPNAVVMGGKHGNLLSTNGTVVMNVATEFANSFKLGYVTLTPEVVDVWSGFNGTGTLLASMTLIPKSWCHKVSQCSWAHAGAGFSGTAGSVTFSGFSGQFGIGSITLGTRYWHRSSSAAAAMCRTQTFVTPEPSSLILLITGVACLFAISLRTKRSALTSQR